MTPQRKKPLLRAWDSDACLSWLQEEPGKWEQCRGVIQKAEAGELMIVVSSLALAEVLMLRGRPSIPKARSERVREFFEHEFVVVSQLDRVTAELAQDLVWDHGINPKDAVHVAAAIRAKVPYLDTFDSGLIAKSGLIGNPPLRIGPPDIQFQEQQSFQGVEIGAS